MGSDIEVTPIVAVVGKPPHVRTRPGDVEVIHLMTLRHWLTRHPGRALGPDDIRALAARAADPAAWVLPADANGPADEPAVAYAPDTSPTRRASWAAWPTRRTT